MNTDDFILWDNEQGLFPLNSTVVFAEHGHAAISSYLQNAVFATGAAPAQTFLPAVRAHALKDQHHLRSTPILDPFAAYYLYDLVLRNHAHYQVQPVATRHLYGYVFRGDEPQSPTSQYHKFRDRGYSLKSEYAHFAKIDIANCFSNFYHHNVELHLQQQLPCEATSPGKFFREINQGVSVNFFPQGIFPAKVIGNHYLSFVDEYSGFSSPAMIRFLDDILFFSDKMADLEQDVKQVQQILDAHNLRLNSTKTRFGGKGEDRVLDDIKKRLLRKRDKVAGYDGTQVKKVELEADEIAYLKSIAGNALSPEEDVELALTLLRTNKLEYEALSDAVFTSHPHLMKHVYRLVPPAGWRHIFDLIKQKLKQPVLTEFELFWCVRMLSDKYKLNTSVAKLLMTAFKHPSATMLVKAAVLENASNDHGFLDLKTAQLKQAPLTLGGMCALAGVRDLEKSKRNYLCKYVANYSASMKVLADIIKSI